MSAIEAPARPALAAADRWRIDAYLEDKPPRAALVSIGRLLGIAATKLPAARPLPDDDWVTMSQAGLEPVRAGRFVVQLVTMSVRKACFRHSLHLDYQTLTKQGTAELMSLFTHDVDTVANGLSLLAGKVVREPLKALACILLAFYINWRVTSLSLVFVPLAIFVFHRFGQSLKKASHRSMESMSRIYKVLEETFDGIKIVLAFNGGRRHSLRFHDENKTYFQKSMKIVTADSMTNPTTEVLGMAAVFRRVPMPNLK